MNLYQHGEIEAVSSICSEEILGTSKSVTMYKTHRRPSSKLEVKTGWNITWRQFWLILLKKQRYCKVNFLTMFRYYCKEDFIPKVELMRFFLKCFSLIWVHNLGVQTGTPALKTLWIRHCQYTLFLAHSPQFCNKKFFSKYPTLSFTTL